MNVHGTTACHPGFTHSEALARLQAGTFEPLLGRLSVSQCQLCPQNHGILDEEKLASLRAQAPSTRLRLHANVRVFRSFYRHAASDYGTATRFYFTRLAELSRWLGADTYSLHAGERRDCTLENLRTRLLALTDLFDHQVAVEGLYPESGNKWLLSCWNEYRWLLDSGLPYALDLSHLSIVARHEKHCDLGLLRELLSAPQCCEIHISDNDGRHDQHRPLVQPPWWWPALVSAEQQGIGAVIFSEGNQRLRATRLAPAIVDLQGYSSRAVHPPSLQIAVALPKYEGRITRHPITRLRS